MAKMEPMDAKSLTADITMKVNIKGMRQWKWRVMIAIQLIRLAAWVMGVGLEVSHE